MAKYLDANGVKYLWSKIKDNFWAKSDLDTTFVEVVDNLPTEGIKRCLYLKATAVEGDNNKYEEYIYIGDLPISETNPYDATKWEKLGEYKAEVDLTPYAKKTDLAWTKDGDGIVYGWKMSSTDVLGKGAVICGKSQTATGEYSSTEGSYNYATGDYSHAEGNGTKAIGANSHSEGYETRAKGTHSHAEGDTTYASGWASHAEGIYNIDNEKALHSRGVGRYVQGGDSIFMNSEYTYYNEDDATDTKNGNIYFLGVGGYDGMSTDATTYSSVQEVINNLQGSVLGSAEVDARDNRLDIALYDSNEEPNALAEVSLPMATDTTLGVVKLYGATTVATDTTDGGYDVKTTNALIGAAPFKNTIGNTATDYNDRESTTNDATFINQPNGKGVTSSIQVKGSGTVKVSSANHVITIQDTAFTGAVGGSGTTSDGTAGYVPAPKKAQYHNYLRGDGTWASAPVTIWGTSATDAAGSGSLSGTAYLNTVIDKGTSGSVINSCAITAGNNMSIIGLTSGGITIGTTATADSALTNAEIDAAIA